MCARVPPRSAQQKRPFLYWNVVSFEDCLNRLNSKRLSDVVRRIQHPPSYFCQVLPHALGIFIASRNLSFGHSPNRGIVFR